jgi:hypothetical protein
MSHPSIHHEATSGTTERPSTGAVPLPKRPPQTTGTSMRSWTAGENWFSHSVPEPMQTEIPLDRQEVQRGHSYATTHDIHVSGPHSSAKQNYLGLSWQQEDNHLQ